MSPVAVAKMHGALNDFIVIDARRDAQPDRDWASFARRWCDRRSGIGADGVILLLNSGHADARMRVINADGSEAEMCGNGMRCAIRFLSELGEGDEFIIETLGGDIQASVLQKGETYSIRLGLGVPRFEERELPYGAQYVSLGNPHAVIFADSQEAIDLGAVGAQMSDINVHLAVPESPHRLNVRHHERGVGFTNACGTGSAATAAAAIRSGAAVSPVDVHVPGGILRVEWDGTGQAYLTGPAVRVFDARI